MNKNKLILNFSLFIFLLTFLGCDVMAEFIHGEKPEPPPPVFTIEFKANGASGILPETQIVNPGTIISLPEIESLKVPGFVFAGWNESAAGENITYSQGENITVNSDLIFYAYWVDDSTPNYIVSFDDNGAISGLPPLPKKVFSGTIIVMPNQRSLGNNGKLFLGWNTEPDGSGNNYITGSIFNIPNKDITLYAIWSYILTTSSETGGTAVPSGKTFYYPGTEVAVKAVPILGYAFEEWLGLPEGSNASNSEIKITINRDMTLTATFRALNALNISFGAGGSAMPSGISFHETGTEVNIKAIPNTGYVFKEWIGVPDGVNALSSEINIIVNNNITLTATFRALNNLTINSSSGGTVSPSGTLFYDSGSEITVKAVPNNGYVFKEWIGAPDGVNALSSEIKVVVNSNITLTATFRELKKMTHTEPFTNSRQYVFDKGFPVTIEIHASGAGGGGAGGHFKEGGGVGTNNVYSSGGAGGGGAVEYLKIENQLSKTVFDVTLGSVGDGGNGNIKKYIGGGSDTGGDGYDGGNTTVDLNGVRRLSANGGKGGTGNRTGGDGGHSSFGGTASGYSGNNGEQVSVGQFNTTTTGIASSNGGSGGYLHGIVSGGSGGNGGGVNSKQPQAGGAGGVGSVVIIFTWYE